MTLHKSQWKLEAGKLARIVQPSRLFLGAPVYHGRVDGVHRRDRLNAMIDLSRVVGQAVMILEVAIEDFKGDPMRKRTVLVLLGEKRVWVEPCSIGPIS